MTNDFSFKKTLVDELFIHVQNRPWVVRVYLPGSSIVSNIKKRMDVADVG